MGQITKFLGKVWDNFSVVTVTAFTGVTGFFVTSKFSDPVYTAVSTALIAGAGAFYIESKYDWVGS